MTFRQQTKHPQWFRFVTGGLLAAVVAACAVAPVTVVGSAPALTAVQSNFAIGVGQEKDLLPFVRVAGSGMIPFGRLVWEVSNPAVLSIDQATGRAKALDKGTVVVQVKPQGNDAGATQLVIEVVEEVDVPVKEIKITPESHHMAVGDSVTLRAQVFLPDGQINGNVLWASSDTTIATINSSNGTVTALKPGRVTMVAAYAAVPSFKGLSDIVIHATPADIPPSTRPALPTTEASAAQDETRPQTPPLATARPADTPAPILSVAPSSPPPTTDPRDTRVVSTLAGSGNAGFADGRGTEAQFYGSSYVAVDASGNVYVADFLNNRIRKVTPEGVVSTLAGSTDGFADGVGAAAQFSNPTGVAADGSGNVYVADMGNHRIRKVTPGGAVTTLAGSGNSGFAEGPVATAQFNGPRGVAVDASGNVYVADTDNHRIRKVTPGAVVSTLAGSDRGYADGTGAAAQLSGPFGLAVDVGGNIYVADTGNARIRVIRPVR